MTSKEEITKAFGELRKGMQKRKFTQGLDLVINLRDVDMTKPENRIEEEVVLPNGRGKDVKIALIADGELAAQAKAAKALVIGSEELASLAEKKKEAKKMAKEYDFFLAQADLMPSVGRYLGPVLGPRGKMPKPLPPNAQIKPILERLKKTVRVRTKDKPLIQVAVGREDMEDKKLIENTEAVLTAVERKLDRGYDNVRSIYLKSTMGSSIKVGR